ncbi:MAG TPA: DUF928 domain-containing protein [Stenomitos sp.]
MMSPRPQIILAFVVSLALVILASSFTHLHAQSDPTSDILAQHPPLSSLVFNQPSTPPDKGAPGQQSDSGTRGPCDSEEESLTATELVALIPAIEKPTSANSAISLPETNVWGLTAAEHPTFWFYIPETATLAKEAKLVLEDEENYRSDFRFTLPKVRGIVSLSIPSTQPPLEISKQYHWSLKIYCNPQKSPSPNFVVDGWIQRVELNPALENQLKVATSQEKIILYAQQGIWFETLTELANLHRTPSEDSNKAWADLLSFIGWAKLTEQPIVSCCTLEK